MLLIHSVGVYMVKLRSPAFSLRTRQSVITEQALSHVHYMDILHNHWRDGGTINSTKSIPDSTITSRNVGL